MLFAKLPNTLKLIRLLKDTSVICPGPPRCCELASSLLKNRAPVPDREYANTDFFEHFFVRPAMNICLDFIQGCSYVPVPDCEYANANNVEPFSNTFEAFNNRSCAEKLL